MFFRLALLLACLLSLALGPVQLSAACALPETQVTCGHCCSETEMACCVAADRSMPVKAPVSVGPQAVDGKLLVSALFVGLCPPSAMQRPSFYQRQAARIPVPPRLDLTCIRLI